MDTSDSFTALDWIAVVLSLLLVVVLFAFPFTVARSFARMFADFGGPLPLVTRLALTPWVAPVLGLIAASPTVIAAAVPVKGSLGLRRGLVVMGFFLGVAALALAFYAMYAPIFELAGKISRSSLPCQGAPRDRELQDAPSEHCDACATCPC